MEQMSDLMDDNESMSVSGLTAGPLRKSAAVEVVLSGSQIRELKKKYNVRQMSCEESELLLQELRQLGIPTREEYGPFLRPTDNLLEVLRSQFRTDINRLYRLAIAGRDSVVHVENLQQQQKLLNVLEQLAE